MQLTPADLALAAHPMERNSHVNGEIRGFLNTISPHVPPSRAPSPEVMLAHIEEPLPLRQFWVRTAVGGRFYPVMGRSVVAVQKQHEGGCATNEQCVVLTDEEYYEADPWGQRAADRATRLERPTELGRAMGQS